MIISPPPQQPTIPVEEPDPSANETENPNKITGRFCSFERVFPDNIQFNERFVVTVIIEATKPVQSIYLEEDGWFREFRLIQEPIQLWLETGVGERRVFSYEVEMWQTPPDSHLMMSGSVSCNVGGLGESEVLHLESQLRSFLTDRESEQ